MRLILLTYFLLLFGSVYSQQTRVSGKVIDEISGEPMPFVKVRFQDSKIGTMTDTAGYYEIETYYATDTIIFNFSGYREQRRGVNKDQTQVIDVTMTVMFAQIEEVTVRPPDEFPSTTLHKKVIANKPINNREKLNSYGYEVYNKIQFDVNNIGEKFSENEIVKRMDLILDYLDSTENGETYLPLLMTESVSNFYYQNKPKKKKEVVKASRITGVENLEVNQFLGDMYLDINVYDNYINLYDKAFVSPVANFARNYYRFYLEDSTTIENQWCYKLRFVPKRKGDLCFEGEMWIHDTTYAVKRVTGTVSKDANINFVEGMYFEQDFDMVEPEVWMLTHERLLVDLKPFKKGPIYGLFAHKEATRKDFRINANYDGDFFKNDDAVEVLDGADNRSKAYWDSIRHIPLSEQEVGIQQMVDSLENTKFFRRMKNITYMLSTGYHPLGKVELGSIYSLVSVNPAEKFRTGLALRTSNNFSRRIELGGRGFYGFGDDKFKYGAQMRLHLSKKKRALLSAYYSYDLEQIGLSSNAISVSSTFGTVFRTGPLDKLTYIEKFGFNLEKDIKKDLILYGGFEWKELVPAGLANYVKQTGPNVYDTLRKIQTTELSVKMRWSKGEEFISGAFDRTTIRSRYPAISCQVLFGIKDLLGGDYNYTRIDLALDHKTPIGVLGSIRYGVNGGYIFGSAAYPFLKVHEANQSYYLYLSTFNKMNFFEFISDKYVGAYIENHWQGLFFDRVPLVRKLKWRLVTGARTTWGQLDDRHNVHMIVPDFRRDFGKIPYLEASVGIENIFKFFRVDLVYRATHQIPDTSPLGIRARWAFNL